MEPPALNERQLNSNATPSQSLAVLVSLLLITAIAVFLRAAQAGESLWLDELHTAWVVAGEVKDVIPRAYLGNQSPLYFWLVWSITQLLGLTEFAVRLPSLLAGTALVPMSYWLVARWTKDRLAAVGTSLLVAIDPDCIFYAQEARPYALVQLVGLLQLFCFGQLLRDARPHWRLLFVASTVMLGYLHYTALLLLPAEIVCYGILYGISVSEPAYRPRQFLVDLIVTALAFLPAAAHLWEIGGRRGNWELVFGRASWHGLLRILPWEIYLLVPMLGLAVGGVIEFWRVRTRPARGDAAAAKRLGFRVGASTWCLLLSWLSVPLFIAWSLSAGDVARLFVLRYLVVISVAPIFLGGVLTSGLRLSWLKCLTLGAMVALSLWQSGMVRQFNHDGRFLAERNQDWRRAARYINQQRTAHELPVLVRSGLLEADRLREETDPLLRAYCLLPVTTIYAVEAESDELVPLPTVAAGRLEARTIELLKRSGGAWLLINGNPVSQSQIADQVQETLKGAGLTVQTDRRRRFGDLVVFRVLCS
jgi:hypothetical protein